MSQNPYKSYLVFYNVVQVIGWSVILVKAVLRPWFLVYTDVQCLVEIFQTAAVLEVLHAALGLVKSNVVLTAFQLSSRVFLVWGVAHVVPEIWKTSNGLPMVVYAWSITEVVRYSFYALGLVNKTLDFLVWCRYSFFLVLYPLGVTGELLAIYKAIPFVNKRNLFSVSMPNWCNMSFHYGSVLVMAMFMYFLVFPQLYSHMLAQRRKVLRPVTAERMEKLK